MKTIILMSIFLGSLVQAAQVCQSLVICNDQIASIQANKTLYDAQQDKKVADIQASIAAMPSPSPSN